MKKFLFILFLPCVSLASQGPLYQHQNAEDQREFQNIYDDISSNAGLKNNQTLSSATISSLTVSTLTVTTSGTITNLSVSTLTVTYIKGRTDGVAPCTGCIGERLVSIAGDTTFPTSTQWGDLTSLTLTPGSWDVTGIVDSYWNAGVITSWFMGVGTVTGNSDPGGSGDHRLGLGNPNTTNPPESSATVAGYPFNVSTNTTIYLKIIATYNSTAPHCSGRISARRVG